MKGFLGGKWRGLCDNPFITQEKTRQLNEITSCVLVPDAKSWQKGTHIFTAAIMRPRFHLFATLFACALLSSCGPPDETANDPFAQHIKELQRAEDTNNNTTFRPPPELARTLGLGSNDTRSEIFFLQPEAVRSFQIYQRALLNALMNQESGLRLTLLDAASKPSIQSDQLRAAIAKKPVAIIIDPTDGLELGQLLAEAAAAKITIIGLNKRLTGCTSIVHCDPLKIGLAAATVTIDSLKRKAAEESRTDISGRVVELRGTEPSTYCDQIAEGFATRLRAQPGIILIHDAPADWTTDNAVQRLGEALRIQRSFDIIFAHSDLIAFGAAKFTNDQKLRENTLIIGTDALPGPKEGLKLLNDGEIDATIAHPPLTDLALQIIVKLRTTPSFKPLPEYEIQPLAVTPKNHAVISRSGSYQLPTL